MIIAAVLVIVVVVFGLTVHRATVTREFAAAKQLRDIADEALWRRYNVVGDMAAWAANGGTPETQALFDRVLAARDAVFDRRGDLRGRLAAEDNFQAALNAFYAAAYRDDDLLGVHEWVVTAARALKADERAAEAVGAYDDAARAFSAGRAPWLLKLYRLVPPAPFGLTISYHHPAADSRPLA